MTKRIKSGEYAHEVDGQTFRIKRDWYKGGWFVWCGTHFKWTDERFTTKADAIHAIDQHHAS